MPRQFDGLRRRVRARTRDDGHTTGHHFDGKADQFAMLIDIDRRRLTRRSDDNDAVRTFLDVVFDQLAEAVVVKAAVLVHRGDNRGNRTGNHVHG